MKTAAVAGQQTFSKNNTAPVKKNLDSGETVALNKAQVTFGKSARSDLAITGDLMVADRTAVILSSPKGVFMQIL